MAKEAISKSCFVICPIGKEGTATRDRSNKLLKHVLKPVFEGRGYRVARADQLSEPGMITNQIVKKIVDCEILVADLTEGNPNVFYELAIRHGLKKPFIHMIDASEAIPFDNAQVRTIQIDLTDLDSVDQAKKELTGQIEAIESGAVPESPISIAFDLEALKASGNTDEAMLAAMFSEVASIRSELRELRRPSQNRPVPPRETSASDIINIIDIVGDEDIAAKLRASDVTVRDGTVTLVTPFDAEIEQKMEADLAKLLKSATGRQWRVSIVPF